MSFTDKEISDHISLIEELFWARRRPALHLRDKIREGQRIKGQTIELFFVRPLFDKPGQQVEEPIAKLQFVRSRGVWRIFWKRADLRWHGYQPHPETDSLASALRIIDKDAHQCFFG